MRPKPKGGGRVSLSRRIFFREPVQRFLIVCEGKETEPRYFKNFRVPKDVKVIDIVGLGRSTLSLVREAVRLRANNEYDQVWCVFDVEDYSPRDIQKAYDLAENNQIKIACSNQAFEIWFLLHFNYYHTAIDRRRYAELLAPLLGYKYTKVCEPFSVLAPLQEQAIQNAKRLLAEYVPHDPSRDNPSTTVHLLVEELNRFTPDSRSAHRLK